MHRHSFPVICAWDFINIDVIHPTATAAVDAMCIAAAHSVAPSEILQRERERERARARMGRTRSSGNLINWHQIRLVIGSVPLLLRMG